MLLQFLEVDLEITYDAVIMGSEAADPNNVGNSSGHVGKPRTATKAAKRISLL